MSTFHFLVTDPSGMVLSSGFNNCTEGKDAFVQFKSRSGVYLEVTEPQLDAVLAVRSGNFVYVDQNGDVTHTTPMVTPTDTKWSEIKLARDSAIGAPLATPYGTFDATLQAQTNILKACQLASTMIAMGQTGNIDFTLADNTTTALTYPQMVEVGLMLGQREQQIRAHATDLRNQIYSPGTDLSTINW